MISPHKINWQIFGEAVEYYEDLGYQYIEVPWRVGPEAIKKTLPSHVDLEIFNDPINLVGSAEQSFVEMMLDGVMPIGKFQAITPCFRNETVYDDLHQPHFMKLELINFGEISDEKLNQMIKDAVGFFKPRVYMNDVQLVQTNDGFDIEHNGIELGSYGIRIMMYKRKRFSWIYGTGIAEPRFSFANSILEYK